MGPTNTGYYSSFKHSSTSTSIPYSTIKFGADGQNLERLTVDMLNDIMIVSLPRIHKDLYLTQAEKVYEILTASLLMFAVFGLFIALSLILISSKELIGNARREVSMLKAFGFSNAKASSLVMTPNIWIMLLAFLIAMPLSLIALSALAALLTAMTGTAVILTLTFAQLATISAFLIGVFGLIYLLGFLSFRRVNPIEAISASND
ncbi:MAG: hypothetical protein DRP42_03555 [Tenericutes bacterium]|nr:MAG: hypothetical protein DRP42_03555 [Mycoplasmatota bacterium]